MGGVGKSFLQQVEQLNNQLQAHITSPRSIHVVLIARSNQILYGGPDGDESYLYSSITLSSWEKKLSERPKEPVLMAKIAHMLIQMVEDDNHVALVDNTSSEKLAYNYPVLLSRGISVITPNKKAFSGPIGLWQSLFDAAANGNGSIKSGSIFHESTVGAGLPVISTLNDLVRTGDKVQRIQGVFSGTLSFLFNQFMPGRKTSDNDQGGNFSDEVCTAKVLGYTEPDPREDLNGLDVARKLTILARIVGLEVESPTSFPVQSLVPKEIEGIEDGNEFIKKLAKFDDIMTKRKEEAEREDKVLRFVGSIEVETKDIRVGLERFVSRCYCAHRLMTILASHASNLTKINDH